MVVDGGASGLDQSRHHPEARASAHNANANATTLEHISSEPAASEAIEAEIKTIETAIASLVSPQALPNLQSLVNRWHEAKLKILQEGRATPEGSSIAAPDKPIIQKELESTVEAAIAKALKSAATPLLQQQQQRSWAAIVASLE